MSDPALLHQLFARHSASPDDDAYRLLALAGEANLPFDLLAQLRELEFPPQPPLPEGLPSTIYYFVPGSRQGSELEQRAATSLLAYLKAADGIGLNLGCPLRLLRALDALLLLSPEERAAPLAALRDPRHHLETVEELLWLTGWRITKVGRGTQLPGTNGDVDWCLRSGGFTIHLEAKFRHSDWPRVMDHDIFIRAGDGFLSKAAHKFPGNAADGTLHVVGITTYDAISEDLVHLVGQELLFTPQIHAVVVRSFLQMTHVLSLNPKVANMVTGLLEVPNGAALPAHYPVIFNIEQRDKRRRQSSPLEETAETKVVHRVFAPANVTRITLPEPSLYRMAIPMRGKDNEPVFQVIPKYLFGK